MKQEGANVGEEENLEFAQKGTAESTPEDHLGSALPDNFASTLPENQLV